MKLIIAGGRDFGNHLLPGDIPDIVQNQKDYELLCDEVTKFISDITTANDSVTIISGLAKGADTLGCRYAQEAEYPLEGFAAEWGKFGRAAGPIRNKLMAKHADALIAFWDGKSRGTAHMIDYAEEMELKVKVVMYDI
jgi:hypothetical protein